MKKKKIRERKYLNSLLKKPAFPLAILIVSAITVINIILIFDNIREFSLALDFNYLKPFESIEHIWKIKGERIALIELFASILLAIVGIAATIGLLKLKKWAWTVMMFLIGVGLFINIADFFRGEPRYPLMLARIIQAILLDQEPVKKALIQKDYEEKNN